LNVLMSFGVNTQQLRSLFVEGKEDPKKGNELLKQYGGIEGLAKKLKCSLEKGVSRNEVSERQNVFGQNSFPEPHQTPLWKFIWEAFKDPVLILLSFFSIASILTGIFLPPPGETPDTSSWIEGAAILVAVLIVILVSGLNNWSKEKRFRELNKIKNDRQIRVIRDGEEDRVSISKVQVGDLVVLETGDFIPADGLFVSGHVMRVDQSAMTGESNPIKKSEESPFLLSMTQVAEGSCRMLVVAVGPNSEWGTLYLNLAGTEPQETPLQEKLRVFGRRIGYFGMGVAVLLFVVLLIRFIVEQATDGVPFQWENLRILLHYALQAVSIVVVAVPEGLPLAVTLSLAYSMKSMLKDHNLVRHLSACETTGSATQICSDKTGTLTENKMTITELWVTGKSVNIWDKQEKKIEEKIDPKVLQLLGRCSAINSTAFLRRKSNSDKSLDEKIDDIQKQNSWWHSLKNIFKRKKQDKKKDEKKKIFRSH